jgi:hypothetical protein
MRRVDVHHTVDEGWLAALVDSVDAGVRKPRGGHHVGAMVGHPRLVV